MHIGSKLFDVKHSRLSKIRGNHKIFSPRMFCRIWYGTSGQCHFSLIDGKFLYLLLFIVTGHKRRGASPVIYVKASSSNDHHILQ